MPLGLAYASTSSSGGTSVAGFWGFSGIVRSILPSATRSLITLLSLPDTLFCPRPQERSAFDIGLSASCRSTLSASDSGCDSGCRCSSLQESWAGLPDVANDCVHHGFAQLSGPVPV